MRRRLRRLRSMVFRRADGLMRIFRLGATRIDYATEVGDGSGSSLVTATLQWIARTFPEAPPTMWPKTAAAGAEELIVDHDLLRLLERPNKFTTGPILWMATVTDWNASGNAYWLKLRNPIGRVVELWWVPSWMMEPKGDEEKFLRHYTYTVNGEEIDIEPTEVVHFRFGMDPENERKGRSPLYGALREVFTDDEAANYTAALLRNMGVPGIIVSPDVDSEQISEDEAEETKAYLKTAFTGDRRGEPYVSTIRMRVSQFGFSPEQLILRELRQIPEERVTAALGIPAVVVGLGAGLARSTFTNMAEAREAAYEAGIIPMQRILAEEVRWQLMTEFENPDRVFTLMFGFDLRKVRVLQEDLYRQAQRFDLAIRGGWAQVFEGRRAIGLDWTDRDRIYLRQGQVVEVPADGGAPRALAPGATSNGTRNGAGAVETAREVADELERRELALPRGGGK